MTAQLDDARLTRLLAQGTGEILKGVRNVGVLRGRNLGDAGDDLAQNWIARVLEQHRPDDGFLSEEAADNPERLDKDRVWIIDPLDGTKEFATGRSDWAVHIALVEKGIPTHAAVGLPDLGVVFHSDEARAVGGPYAKKIAISHNRPPKVALHIADELGFQTAAIGSAGAKAYAAAWDVPFYGVNHLVGHVAVDLLDHGALPMPSLALLVSGGHTSLLYVEDIATKITEVG